MFFSVSFVTTHVYAEVDRFGNDLTEVRGSVGSVAELLLDHPPPALKDSAGIRITERCRLPSLSAPARSLSAGQRLIQ